MISLIFTCITKTCLYNFDPLKPHFYIVKLGFTGVYFIFLLLLKNIEAVLTNTHNLYFEQKYEKNQKSENFHFLVVKFSVYLNRRVFVMSLPKAYFNSKRFLYAVCVYIKGNVCMQGICVTIYYTACPPRG